ncbi:unnamed protein product, partial [Ectocarpus fasciculatus]
MLKVDEASAPREETAAEREAYLYSTGHLGVYVHVGDDQLCETAARNGHLEILQWARRIGCPWEASTCYGAAENGHLEILQWATNNGCP